MTEPAIAYPRSTDKAPDAYRTISEVANELGLPQHVLRFWESRFVQIRPLKRGGGRRYYRPDEIALLKGIQHLLYNEGYTIKGVQKVLKSQGVRAVQGLGAGRALADVIEAEQGDFAKNEIQPIGAFIEENLAAEDTQDTVPEAEPELESALPEEVDEPSLFDSQSKPQIQSEQVEGKAQRAQIGNFAARLRALRAQLYEIRERLDKQGDAS